LIDACVPFKTLMVRLVGIGCAGEVVSVMRARGVIPGGSGFPVRWFGGFAVVELPAGGDFLTPPALAGELCAVLDAGAAGLIADLPGAGACDSACLDALMRAARRARGWGAWLRLVVRDPGARKVVRLVALDGLMPVHASVTGAVQAAAREEAATGAAGGGGPAIGLALSDAGAEGGVDLLTVSVSAREGYTLVSLDGEGDVTVRGTLHAALTAQMSAEAAHLVVDLTRLAYIDASCVQVLWRVSRMAEGAGGRLGLAAPQPLVARVMELWGVGQVIGVHESVAEAVIAAAR
jgi:anti-sigma B factor antagonist